MNKQKLKKKEVLKGALKLKYTTGISASGIQKVLSKADILLSEGLKRSTETSLAYGVGINLFRQIYKTTWVGGL